MFFASARWLFKLSILGAVILVAACTPPAAEKQDKNWTDPNDLFETSDRIIAAQFIESTLETVQLIDSVTGAIAGETEVLFRQFEVSDSLKGTADADDLLWIAFAPGKAGELLDGLGSVKEFVGGPTYLLFLKGRLRPLEYPVEFGAVLWTGNGEPSFAEIFGERLLFRAEGAYVDLIQRDGRTLPDPLSAAPFTLTLEEVRAATD